MRPCNSKRCGCVAGSCQAGSFCSRAHRHSGCAGSFEMVPGATAVAVAHTAWHLCWRMQRTSLAQHHGHSRCSHLSPLAPQAPAASCTRQQPELQRQQQAPAGPPCTGATTRPAAVCPRPGVWGLHLRTLQSRSLRTPHWWWLQLTAPPAGSPLRWGSPAVRDPPRGVAQARLAPSHLLCMSLLRVRSNSLQRVAWEALVERSQKHRAPANDPRHAEERHRIMGSDSTAPLAHFGVGQGR